MKNGKGENETELPERILFAMRFHQFDLSSFPNINEWENSQIAPSLSNSPIHLTKKLSKEI